MHVVIIGGGYAGLSAAIYLRKKIPHGKVTLFDKKNFFLKKTYLHKTVHTNIENFKIPYPDLAFRFGFNFYQAEIPLNLEKLIEEKAFLSPVGIINFDYLILTTGAQEYIPFTIEDNNYCSLSQIEEKGLKITLEKLPHGSEIAIIGAGASGIQFLFEIISCYGKKFFYKLINYGDLILDYQNELFHHEIFSNILKYQIQYFPHRKVLELKSKEVLLENLREHKKEKISADFFLIFTGVLPFPRKFHADKYGRLIFNQKAQDFIFVAGDCSYFQGGENSLTAQVAVRKGKLVAENILRLYEGKNLQEFLFQELGYFVSLGRDNACGYLIHKNIFLKGPLALFLKELAEKQFDLYLQGFDLLL